MKAFEPYAYTLLRIFAGFMFLWHGVQKIFLWPPPAHVVEGLYMKWLGGGIERWRHVERLRAASAAMQRARST